MFKRDNWGSAARFGQFIVGSEAVPEAEWYAMAPANVSVHAARVTARAPWAHWNGDRSAVALSADVQRGGEQFASMRLSAIVIGHSSSSFAGGPGWDAAIIEQLRQVIGEGPVITTNGLDCLAAMRATGIQQPMLVLPPWFGPATATAATAYLEAHGITPALTLSYDPGPQWREVPPAEMYPRGLGFEQAIDTLHAQIVAQFPDTADGVLIAGTGFRCVGMIDALERALERPVVTANQASLWHCLRVAEVDTSVEGYGRLLAEH